MLMAEMRLLRFLSLEIMVHQIITTFLIMIRLLVIIDSKKEVMEAGEPMMIPIHLT